MNSVKGTLLVNNFRVWAYHGWYEEERKIGAEYQIDTELRINLPQNGLELDHTVDYQEVVDTITKVMKEEFRLIEDSCLAIFKALETRFTSVLSLQVTVTKLNIPINNLESTSFTVSS